MTYVSRPLGLVPTAAFVVAGALGLALRITWLAAAGFTAALGALLTHLYLTRRTA